MGNSSGSSQISRRHHFVPQFHLRYFANEKEQLLVHRVDRDKSYPATVRDTGHRNYGHSLYIPNREPDHNHLEGRMSDLERHTAAVVDELSSGSGGLVSDEARIVLSWYMALQWTRNRFRIDYMRASLRKELSED